MDEQLQRFILEHELEQHAAEFGRRVQEEAQSFKRHLKRSDNMPRLTQVRSLANALAPQGAADTPSRRLARLHELAAGQVQRLKPPTLLPKPFTQMTLNEADLPDKFWVYIAGRLGGLRMANAGHPGELEHFWAKLRSRYGERWPEHPDAETETLIHLCLAETFVYHLTETWEYSDPESEAHDETTL